MTYNESTTAAEVIEGVDLTGRIAVITGASGGIGLETARALASAGATVVLGIRDASKATAAAADLHSTVPTAQVELGDLDLTSLASVRTFAAWVNGNHDRIDLLVNNAGVMATPFQRTPDGFELQFGTNHLAHFLLTKLLLPGLLAAESARVVTVSSGGHKMGGINWADPNYHTTEYSPWPAYGQSKTANILFTIELERRLGPRGVHAYAIHPGTVGTDLFRYLTDEGRTSIERRISDAGVLVKTPAQGAATSVMAATYPRLTDQGGSYLVDCHVSDDVADHAQDAEDAERLWALSDELVGESFTT